MHTRTRFMFLLLVCLYSFIGRAQEFLSVNWDDELRIDTVLPVFSQTYPLDSDYDMYDYDVRIEYPEFEKVPDADVAKLEHMQATLPDWPEVKTFIGVSSKKGVLHADFIPIVWRGGSYQRITSLKLTLKRTLRPQSAVSRMGTRIGSSERYAEKSVLAEGRWVKIRVSSTGVYKITNRELSSMGFSNPANVRLYGYGGFMLPETRIYECIDDLQEVPLWRESSFVLFYANGTISWKRKSAGLYEHTQNTYSNYAYYFLTENSSEAPMEFPKETLEANGAPSVNTYPDYALYEKDSYSWMTRGRLFLDDVDYKTNTTQNYRFSLPGVVSDATARITVSFAAEKSSTLSVAVGENRVGSLYISSPSSAKYENFTVASSTFTYNNGLSTNTNLSLTHSGGSSARLDYITLNFTRELALRGAFTNFRTTTTGNKLFTIAGTDANTHVWRVTEGTIYTELTGAYANGIYSVPASVSSLSDEFVAVNVVSTSFPSVEVVGTVANQNLHGMEPIDMLIVVPTSSSWQSQAERLADLHREKDGLRVEVLRADQIYNEYSSGTPDATAIRRFLKMLYDRAATSADEPKYLLLFADGAWDNRMVSSSWRRYTPDNFLLCFESGRSNSETESYVMEEYYGLLDDGEGVTLNNEMADVAVGRLPVRTLEQATAMVDKIEAYLENKEAGSWKNKICILGDDGDSNTHMRDANDVSKVVRQVNPNFIIEKIFWDAYPRETVSTGMRYPAVQKHIYETLEEGALMVNYSGHGRAETLSHEYVWNISDMQALASPRLPLWLTSSCDTSPFDMAETNLGEEAILNTKGGAIGMIGTTRTVFQSTNLTFNKEFCRRVLDKSSGKYNSIGEALRLAKNATMSSSSYNHLHYVLLGDPAIRLAVPNQHKITIKEFDGRSVEDDEETTIQAGSQVTVKGNIVDESGRVVTDFNGVIYPTIYDSEETIFCRGNDPDLSTIFSYDDRSKKLFAGSDSVRNGEFSFTFPVPLDISYSDESGAAFLYALENSKQEAQGMFDQFLVGGTKDGLETDSIGPEINLYLNTADFMPGGKVNETPLLVISLHDEDGINAIGSGIGHDLIAIVDNDPAMTYVLNNYYISEPGDYRRGSVTYSLPEMEAGIHTLFVRAWDVMNNSSSVEVPFEVVVGLRPALTDVWCTQSPARESTTFVIAHDRPATELTVKLEVFDFSGRILWTHTENGTSSGNSYRVDWNLTTTSGQPIGNGIYLYRATISSSGGSESTRTRKIAVVRQ